MNPVLKQIAEIVLSADRLREASYDGKGYTRSISEASDAALNIASVVDPDVRSLVHFLHASGEGIDVCMNMRFRD